MTNMWHQVTFEEYLQQLELEKLTDEELVRAIEDRFGVTTTKNGEAHTFKLKKRTFEFHLDRLIGNGDWEEEIENPTGPIVIMWDVMGRQDGGGGPADSIEEVIKHFSHYIEEEE